jgi:hypothetical protein
MTLKAEKILSVGEKLMVTFSIKNSDFEKYGDSFEINQINHTSSLRSEIRGLKEQLQYYIDMCNEINIVDYKKQLEEAREVMLLVRHHPENSIWINETIDSYLEKYKDEE